MVMEYYRKAQEKKKQEKHQRWNQQRIQTSEENMKCYQINCRGLPHCRNAQTRYCFACKRNRAVVKPQQDYFNPKIPGIKFL